jgi:hypothetical protein
MDVIMATEERIWERQSPAREWVGFWRRQWRGIRVAWKRKYLWMLKGFSRRFGGLLLVPGRVATYKTYHAANLECARVVQYSSIDKIVSFAASRHLNTAKLSVLDELRSL